ncbi:AraC family transcriptional regulator [Metasolibacillus meyeri]|uniref:AraC family transcriptional regulator n=1 Tax=Metasolibacillus meyeri TaxID=1071052 RepID=A0AAW9NQV0_9BACL|nr:AraC family transcriptional regulator [Metasolibacillus meyeri]MEC1177684.1 AraC family transcriptional regulator [Metasolibacillus meyeri]
MKYDADRFLVEQMFIKVTHVEYVDTIALPYTAQVKSNVWLMVIEGDICLSFDNKQHHASGFQLIHLAKEGYFTITSKSNTRLYIIYYSKKILYGDSLLKVLLQRSAFNQPLFVYPVVHTETVVEVVDKLYWHYQHQQKLAVQACFHQLMTHTFMEIEQQELPKNPIQQALDYIDRHLHELVTVQDVAVAIQLSEYQLWELFKKHFGQSTKQYIQERQRQLAEHYLLQPHYQIKDVMRALNFDSEVYFSRLFKKWTGYTPSEFTKKSANLLSEKSINNENRFHYNENYLARGIQLESKEHELVMKRNRMNSIKLPFLISLLALLVACGDDTTQTTNSNDGTAQTEETATRVIVDTAGREVEIPAKPEQIVMQGNAIGDLVALGIEPIGVDRRFIDSGVIEDKGKISAADIGYPTNFEQVLSLKPDLIMLGYVMDDEIEKASKIAPTVTFDGMLPLKERFPTVADLVGKKEEGEKILKDYEENVGAMWQQLYTGGVIAEGETAVVLQYYWNKTMYVMKTGGVANLLYHPAGLAMDEKVQALQPNSGPYIEIAEESMHDLLIGDHLFVLVSVDPEAKKVFEELQQKPLWNALPAVKNKKVHYVEDSWNYTDMTTSTMLLEEMPNILTK